MNEQKKGFIKVCPACGYSFKDINIKTEKQTTKCPMCGYEFASSKMPPNKPNDFGKKII